MAKKAAPTVLAVALCAVIHIKAAAGDLVEGTAAQLKPYIDDGSLDPHKEAVAAAKERRAPVVQIPPPLDRALLAAVEDAHAMVGHLEALHQASPEGEREFFAAKLAAARGTLSDLTAA